jgi:abortive infection bacteriophage resistance protein
MTKINYSKPVLTYVEQINLLKKRGLIINDEKKALHLLENISYYRLSAYWFPLLDNPKSSHKFKPDATFERAFDLYCFDRELRKMVASEIEKIEISVRAKMIYVLSNRYGAFWFKNFDLFKSEEQLKKTLAKLEYQKSRSDEDFINSFYKKYYNKLPPSWMILEISSFGNLSSLYKNLKPSKVKRSISNYYGLDERTFESWLHSLTYVRNICAHHSRFWNKRMSIQPIIPKNPKYDFLNTHNLQNQNESGKYWKINDRTYFILSMVIYLLNVVNPNNTFKSNLSNLFDKHPYVDKKALGFPAGWKKEPIWKL